VPVLLFEIYQHIGMHDQRICFTIHNFAHQGRTGEHILWATGLNRQAHFVDDTRLRDNANDAALNLLKGGIVYYNVVTRVSPRYAWEAQNADQGMGLGHKLDVHRGKFEGVLNGIDYDVWKRSIGSFPFRRGSRPSARSRRRCAIVSGSARTSAEPHLPRPP
jgi:starch synthase